MEVQQKLVTVLQSLERPREGADVCRRALPAAERLARLCPGKLACRQEEAELYDALVFTTRNNDAAAAVDYSSKEIRALQQILKSFPDDNSVILELASA